MTFDVDKPERARHVGAAIALLAATFAVAGLGSLATSTSVDTWYAGLEKPEFNPPNAVFAPVWTALYAIMAVAAWRIWRASGGHDSRRAVWAYAIQLVLNLLWSLLFFGLRRPGAALIEIALLFVAIVVTARMFWRIDRPAGLMMVPYAAWVAFASVLNFEVWRLN